MENTDETLARKDGFTADGSVAGDYLAAGRDPWLPRKTAAEIQAAIENLPEAQGFKCKVGDER